MCTATAGLWAIIAKFATTREQVKKGFAERRKPPKTTMHRLIYFGPTYVLRNWMRRQYWIARLRKVVRGMKDIVVARRRKPESSSGGGGQA